MKRTGTKRAKSLRRRLTDAERRLWYVVSDRRLAGHKFKRQVPIDPWIVDFLCAESMLVVEVDGGQHSESRRDTIRDADLVRRGYRVIRFWNHDVLRHTNDVVETLLSMLEPRTGR